MTEANALTFTVTATDADGDHVALSATGVPSGASAVDQGNNTLNFAWTPSTGQAGTYTVTFHGDDGHGGTMDAATTITVNAPGGGGTGATITLVGKVNRHNDRTCFRIAPVDGSFDPRHVDLSTFTLQFNGAVISALANRVHVMTDCEDDHDGDGGGDCDNGDHDDTARLHRDGDGHGDGEGDDDDDDCEECDSDCGAVGIKACFATHDLIAAFGENLEAQLADATIHFKLDDGTEIVATFSGPIVFHGEGHHKMDARAMPNPLNPRTVLSFTLSRPGRVQVAVYDLQGRLVNKLSDEVRNAGPQSLVWDGSDSRNARVGSGVYFFRIQAPEGQVVQRVAVVK